MEYSRVVDHLWLCIRNDPCISLQEELGPTWHPTWDKVWEDVHDRIDIEGVALVRAEVWRDTRAEIY